MQTKQYFKFIGFKGDYGGDVYEKELMDELSNTKIINLKICLFERKGGIKSLLSLFGMIAEWIKKEKCKIIRPFGIPIYSKGMTIIIHHYDQTGSPWYTKAIENIDFLILKKLNNFLKFKIIVVSEFWKQWALENFDSDVYVIYNNISIPKVDISCGKDYFKSRYGLDPNKKWIFLGSSAQKKGGHNIVDIIYDNKKIDLFNEYQFICSGENNNHHKSSVSYIKFIWISKSDYGSFLKNCEVVIANSLFLEGWCRVLHESALLGVPVIGSGSGGMGELLQIINLKTKYSESEIVELIEKGVFCKPKTSRLKKINLQRNETINNWIKNNEK